MSLVGVVTLHSAGNVLSDWFDHRSGVDNEKAYAVPNLVFGHFQPKEYLVFSAILFIVGIALGLGITAICGAGLLVIGGIGVLLTAAYSFLKYHALGDLDIFLIFGVLTVLGTAYAITGTFMPEALVVSVPTGVITVSVLHANNTSDSVSDREAGIRTFGMLIGPKAAAMLYCIYMVVPFLWVAVAAVAGWMHPLALLCLPAAVQAYRNFRQGANAYKEGISAMEGLDLASAKLQLMFSVLLSAGLFIAGLL
jgi:1,4-dihydroxy-2-naphthoate octaprenyltransferase